MQTKREWLAEQGLAKPGARGKFSTFAHAALARAASEGIAFSDDAPSVVVKRARKAPSVTVSETTDAPKPVAPYVPQPLPPEPVIRKVKQLVGYTVEGFKVGFIHCMACTKHVNYCSCVGGPLAPKMVTTLDKDSPARVG